MTVFPPPETSLTRPTGARERRARGGLSLQGRDYAIIAAVHRHRVLTSQQLATLFFPTSAEEPVNSACRTRLRILVRAGLLERHEQPVTRAEGRRPYLYMMTDAGVRLLLEDVGYTPEDIDWKPSFNNVAWPFLRHQLAINDLYVIVSTGAAQLGWNVANWVDDRILRRSHTARLQVPGAPPGDTTVVIPDAYFTIRTEDGQFHFLAEVDRSTMSVAPSSLTTKSWERRILGYQALFDSPVIEELYGTSSIRVLTVTTGERRLLHLKKAIEDVGGMKRYWLATAASLTADTVFIKPVWHVASVSDTRALLA